MEWKKRESNWIVVNVIINRAADAGLECLLKTSIDGSRLFVRRRWLTDTVVTQHRGPWNDKTVGVESVSFAMIARYFVFGPSQYSSYEENWTYCIFPHTECRLHLQGVFVAAYSSWKCKHISKQSVLHLQWRLRGIPFMVHGLSCVPTHSSWSVG